MFRMKFTFPALLSFMTLFAVSSDAQVQNISTISGTGIGGFSGDGADALSAQLNAPHGVLTDDAGNVYILDYLNYRIRKINTSGNIATIAGNGGISGTGDGSVATSAEVRPYGMALDKDNNLYISDASWGVIRKVNSAGIISTIAGVGVHGNTGNGGPASAAKLHGVYGLAFDTSGNLYLADGISNVVRKIDKSGIISRFAGDDTAGYSGDGLFAIAARLDSPYAVATDIPGNVYISDMKNNVIRKVLTDGTIVTYAGTGSMGHSGDGGPATAAELNRPAGLCVDNIGNLYIADADNDVIRKVDTAGIITTVVGNGTPGFGGDLGPVNGANLHTPFDVAVDAAGTLYIADANNQRIRKTYMPVSVAGVENHGSVLVTPNPFSNKFTLTGINKTDKVAVYNLSGRAVSVEEVTNGDTKSIDMTALPSGVYVLSISDASGSSKVVKVVKE